MLCMPFCRFQDERLSQSRTFGRLSRRRQSNARCGGQYHRNRKSYHGGGRWNRHMDGGAIHSCRARGLSDRTTLLRYPMEPSPDLTPAECSDIFAYLKNVPMLHKQIDRSSSAKLAIDASDGDKIYHKYSCYSCHGETGAGVCDLRQGYIKYPTDSALTAWIKNPSRTVPIPKCRHGTASFRKMNIVHFAHTCGNSVSAHRT